MAMRMGIPLGAGLLVHLQNGALAAAGLLYCLAAFYPVTLAVETALSLPPAAGPAHSSKGSGKGMP